MTDDHTDRGSAQAGGDHGGHGHAHGHDAGPASDHWYHRFRYWAMEWLEGIYHGMIEHPAFEKIEKEAEDIEDVFLFACFADAFGIPSPVSYYTVELLPYLAEEFEQWERRMWDRETLLERKGQQYHFH
jgi:hypothetical protein